MTLNRIAPEYTVQEALQKISSLVIDISELEKQGIISRETKESLNQALLFADVAISEHMEKTQNRISEKMAQRLNAFTDFVDGYRSPMRIPKPFIPQSKLNKEDISEICTPTKRHR